MKTIKIIEVDREFSSPYVSEKLKKTTHKFRIGGKNNEVEQLAMCIAESGTSLMFQPRYRAKEAIKQMKLTGQDHAMLIRSCFDYSHDVYAVYASGKVVTVATGVTAHRANVISEKYDTRNVYPADVWHNYCTNGYTTRIGLDRAAKYATARCKQIARSHAEYDDQIYTGEEGHALRAGIR